MPREDGYKNLVPMDQRSEDEARSLGQQGGIASGVARRRKRSMREAADYYLALPGADRRGSIFIMSHFVYYVYKSVQSMNHIKVFLCLLTIFYSLYL